MAETFLPTSPNSRLGVQQAGLDIVHQAFGLLPELRRQYRCLSFTSPPGPNDVVFISLAICSHDPAYSNDNLKRNYGTRAAPGVALNSLVPSISEIGISDLDTRRIHDAVDRGSSPWQSDKVRTEFIPCSIHYSFYPWISNSFLFGAKSDACDPKHIRPILYQAFHVIDKDIIDKHVSPKYRKLVLVTDDCGQTQAILEALGLSVDTFDHVVGRVEISHLSQAILGHEKQVQAVLCDYGCAFSSPGRRLVLCAWDNYDLPVSTLVQRPRPRDLEIRKLKIAGMRACKTPLYDYPKPQRVPREDAARYQFLYPAGGNGALKRAGGALHRWKNKIVNHKEKKPANRSWSSYEAEAKSGEETRRLLETIPPQGKLTQEPVLKPSDEANWRSSSLEIADVDNYAEAGNTCYFWYHQLPCELHKRKECPSLHALTDPQTFVRVPPSYVYRTHKTYCGRELCLGNREIQEHIRSSAAKEGDEDTSELSEVVSSRHEGE